MADLNLTVRYEEIEDGWVMASVVELPGVRTQGETREAARENILDALKTALQAKSDLAPPADDAVAIENLSFALTA